MNNTKNNSNRITTHHSTDRWAIHEGDINTVLPALPQVTFDGVFCDPPYGIEFMRHDWDGNVPSPIRPLNMVNKSIPWVVYSKGQFQESAKWMDTFVNSPRQKEWHPWQRPLTEVEELVRYFSDKNDLVVDPCGGGFTTAIACLNKGRRFIGCDIDKAAVVKGRERLAKELREDATLPTGLIPLGTNQVALAG